MGRERTPASFGGKDLLSSWPSGTPTDASGAFRSNPRPSTKALIPFFQIAKLLQNIKFENPKYDGLVKSCHSGLPVPGRQVKTGVQDIYKHLKILDSGWSLSR